VSLWSLLTVLAVPALFWIGWFYYRDRHKPEPILAIGLSFALGVGCARLAEAAYDLLDPLWSPALPHGGFGDAEFFLYCVVVIGVIEEGAKFLVFIAVCVRLRSFDEEMDGIVYAATVALGFASYENFLYLEVLAGVELYARAISSPLVHTIFSSIWGWAYAKAAIAGRPAAARTALAFAIAVVAHGLYDYLAMSTVLAAGSSLIVLGLWIWRLKVKRRIERSLGEPPDAA
jgi:protease PrsW